MHMGEKQNTDGCKKYICVKIKCVCDYKRICNCDVSGKYYKTPTYVCEKKNESACKENITKGQTKIYLPIITHTHT